MKEKEVKSTEFLLEREWNKDRKRMIIFMVLTFPTICGFIIVLLIYRQKKAEYMGIKGLRDDQKDYALKDIVGKKVVYHDQAYAHIYAIYALADLDCTDCAL
ncbi:MAG: hypothetical protein ACFFDW_14095 [Candidatus Thorarchaeota archaeon]